jgi:hypothetical protein
VLEQIRAGVAADGAALVKQVKGVILLQLQPAAGGAPVSFTIDLKNGAGSAYNGPPKAGTTADVTLSFADADFADIAAGKLNPQNVSSTCMYSFAVRQCTFANICRRL